MRAVDLIVKRNGCQIDQNINRFWRLMSEVIGADLVPLPYEVRLETLLRHGVGLWDVVAQAHRPGSLDGRIRDRDDNDLVGLLRRFPNVRVLAFNGGTAARLGTRALGLHVSNYRLVQLPSSSPAHTLAYAEKLSAWKALTVALAGCCPGDIHAHYWDT